MKIDGNVAFKVTWVYGQKGPFTAPCTAKGRHINIHDSKKGWCSQPECRCNQAFHGGNTDPPVAISQDGPCMDVHIFTAWRFGGGTSHTGTQKGLKRKIKYAKAGRIAFYTTRDNNMNEEQRLVIGAFRIGTLADKKGETIVIAAGNGPHLRVADLSRAPRFWDFHKQPGGPSWRTGLFRYISDTEAAELLKALQDVALEVH